jgi:Cu-Zn family superoxide dismutase
LNITARKPKLKNTSTFTKKVFHFFVEPLKMSATAHLDYGTITFSQVDTTTTRVKINVCNGWLTDGKHGFHIHESGSTVKGCSSMGGHYNPTDTDHGDLTSGIRHNGDLGNVASVDGCIVHVMDVPNMNVKDIVGRGIVVHEKEDDLGVGESEESKRTGNSGGRLMCAPIVWASP